MTFKIQKLPVRARTEVPTAHAVYRELNDTICIKAAWRRTLFTLTMSQSDALPFGRAIHQRHAYYLADDVYVNRNGRLWMGQLVPVHVQYEMLIALAKCLTRMNDLDEQDTYEVEEWLTLTPPKPEPEPEPGPVSATPSPSGSVGGLVFSHKE